MIDDFEKEDDNVEENNLKEEDQSYKTAAHTLCELTQSKCTWTCHKDMLCRNLQVKDTEERLFDLAQSKCSWTCLKSQLMRKFTDPRPQTKTAPPRFMPASAVEMHLGMSQEAQQAADTEQAKPARQTLC